MISRANPLGLVLIATAGTCLAQVQVLSRTSTLVDRQTNSLGLPPVWDEVGSYTLLGTGTITLPHGATHTSTVTASGISGTFQGSSSSSGTFGSGTSTYREASLDTTFLVTQSAMPVRVTLNGDCNPGVNSPKSVTDVNAYFVIEDATTGEVLLDSAYLGATAYDPNTRLLTTTWTNNVGKALLLPGTYRIRASGNGGRSDSQGGGSGSAGFGKLTASMVFADPSGVVKFEFPRGRPATLIPGQPTAVYVNVTSDYGSPVDGTGVLYTRVDRNAPFVATPMVQLAADQYVGVLPALGCPGSVDYYFRVEANNHELCALPYEAPFRYFTTESDSHAAVHAYDSESTDGFTVISNGATSGVWESAKPLTGTGVPYGDYDYSGKAWVTDNRDGFDVDGGPVQLLTPVQDLSTSTRVVLSYARWFGCNRGDDRLVVQVSANGGATWKTLENVSSQPYWREMTFELASLIPLTSNVLVRFSVTDSPDNSTTEAGIDAITFRTYRCTPACAADLNLDGFLDYTDFDDFVTLFEAGSAASDANGDGFLDYNDFDTFVTAFETGC